MQSKFRKAAKVLITFLLFASIAPFVSATPPQPAIFQIKIYQFKTADQESAIDKYLENALLPLLHRSGITEVGVFKPIANDTAAIKKIYLFIPFKNLDDFGRLPGLLAGDSKYRNDAKDWVEAPYNNPPYLRIESIVLKAFPGMTGYEKPQLKGSSGERIYELRSYEGPTEEKFENKVRMFNDGDEIGLFKRLGFNAVFYASVISGAHMPNLMYMTSFDNMVSHDQHWKAFVDDPQWKKLISMPEYQNNVSHIDIVLLHPTPYSDL